MSRFALGLSLAATLASGQALAADLLQWQDNSLTYLNGIDFKVDPPKQQTVTFEHASGWSFGDLFIFVDGIKYNTEATNGAGDGHTFYGEISPRLSLGKISGAYASCRATKCSPSIQKYLGITLLPQAGVALGMAATAAQLSDGHMVRNVVLFSVLVYELAGPTLTKIALTAAGAIRPEGRTSARVENKPEEVA